MVNRRGRVVEEEQQSYLGQPKTEEDSDPHEAKRKCGEQSVLLLLRDLLFVGRAPDAAPLTARHELAAVTNEEPTNCGEDGQKAQQRATERDAKEGAGRPLPECVPKTPQSIRREDLSGEVSRDQAKQRAQRYCRPETAKDEREEDGCTDPPACSGFGHGDGVGEGLGPSKKRRCAGRHRYRLLGEGVLVGFSEEGGLSTRSMLLAWVIAFSLASFLESVWESSAK